MAGFWRAHPGCFSRAPKREAFETLLAINPDYLPSRRLTSPKITRFLERVRREYATPSGPPSLSHQPPERATRRQTRLTLEVTNFSPRLRPVVRYRAATSPGYLDLDATEVGPQTTFSVRTQEGGSDLLYYFVLGTRDGVPVGRLGTARQPFRLRVPERRGVTGGVAAETPWYRTWWFWTLTGAVVVGTGVGLGVGLTRDGGVSASVTILRRDASGKSVPIFAP